MKKITYLVLVCNLLLISCGNQPAGQESNEHSEHMHAQPDIKTGAEAKPASPHQTTMANIGATHVHVDYSAPSVRNRIIWNGLVAYDQVWVTGAHRATSIDFSTDVMIDGHKIPKGKYAFFTIPSQEEWTLILNKNYDQHLADDYDQNLDLLRIKVKPEILDQPVETLTYNVNSGEEGKGSVTMSWEKIRVTLPIGSE